MVASPVAAVLQLPLLQLAPLSFLLRRASSLFRSPELCGPFVAWALLFPLPLLLLLVGVLVLLVEAKARRWLDPS